MDKPLRQMGCDYKNVCPSASGWCNVGAPAIACVKHILAQYQILEKEIKEYKDAGITPETLDMVREFHEMKVNDVSNFKGGENEKG